MHVHNEHLELTTTERVWYAEVTRVKEAPTSISVTHFREKLHEAIEYWNGCLMPSGAEVDTSMLEVLFRANSLLERLNNPGPDNFHVRYVGKSQLRTVGGDDQNHPWMRYDDIVRATVTPLLSEFVIVTNPMTREIFLNKGIVHWFHLRFAEAGIDYEDIQTLAEYRKALDDSMPAWIAGLRDGLRYCNASLDDLASSPLVRLGYINGEEWLDLVASPAQLDYIERFVKLHPNPVIRAGLLAKDDLDE
jgi:hypothetical protein